MIQGPHSCHVTMQARALHGRPLPTPCGTSIFRWGILEKGHHTLSLNRSTPTLSCRLRLDLPATAELAMEAQAVDLLDRLEDCG